MKISKLFAGTLAGMLAALSLGSAVSANAADLGLGDPSGDGIINAVDASYILSLYADFAVNNADITQELLSLCDVNKDGSVNAMDASYVLSYYVDQSLNDTDISIEEFIDEFISELQTWSWPDTSSLDPQDPWNPWVPWNPWNPWDPQNPLDPNSDQSPWLPEGFFDGDNQWTWPVEDSNPWASADISEKWDVWYKNVPTEPIENWLEKALNEAGVNLNE